MSQHAVLFYARSGFNGNTMDANHDEKLMHAAGLQTRPGTHPSTHSTDQDTSDSLVKEFGNLFDPQARRRVFESEVSKLFRRPHYWEFQNVQSKTTPVSQVFESEVSWEFQDVQPKNTPVSQVAPVAHEKPIKKKQRSSPSKNRREKDAQSRSPVSASEKRNSSRRIRKTANVYQAGFN
jgi:hypothetical protein